MTQVKFQFYDNDPIPLDGYAIDDVMVYEPVGPLVYTSPTVDDDNVGQSSGNDDGVEVNIRNSLR